jgi:hypothetical protein
MDKQKYIVLTGDGICVQAATEKLENVIAVMFSDINVSLTRLSKPVFIGGVALVFADHRFYASQAMIVTEAV